MATWVKVRRDDEKLVVGDRIDHARLGEIELKEYYFIGYDKCPHCKSRKTYHSEHIRIDPQMSNCFGTSDTYTSTNTYSVFKKNDVCLKCGTEWMAQLFVWKVINPNKSIRDKLYNLLLKVIP